MKTTLDCIVCLFHQALNTSRFVTKNRKTQQKILEEVARYVARGISMDQPPAAMSKPVYGIVARVTGIRDPYRTQKRETNKHAMEMAPGLHKVIGKAKDPLDSALRVAAAGNIIDLGIGHKFNLDTDIHRIMHMPFAIQALRDFRRELKPGRKLLYLGDNSGEIVFDALLIEHLLKYGIDITFAVKSGPIINDATMEDARAVGMTKLVRVIETGGNDVGIDWRNVSKEFLRSYKSADFIIGKGHGNFETCNDSPGNFYFLLKCKCEMVAAELGTKLGDMVFLHKRINSARNPRSSSGKSG